MQRHHHFQNILNEWGTVELGRSSHHNILRLAKIRYYDYWLAEGVQPQLHDRGLEYVALLGEPSEHVVCAEGGEGVADDPSQPAFSVGYASNGTA